MKSITVALSYVEELITMEASSPSERYWLCPLYSFNCDCECLDLAKGTQIKPALDKLRKYIGERTYHLYGRWEDPSEFDWVAFLPYSTIATEGTIAHRMAIGFEEWDSVSESLVDLITALKLCHKGRVTAGPLISASIHNSEWAIGGGTIWTPVSKKDFIHEEPKYVLYQSHAPQVTELANNLSKLRELGKLDSLDIALRRFHSAYHGDIEDRIIDQMIAFESLYLGDSQELTYKLALRMTFLLAEKEEERMAIFGDIKKAYNYRSRIVHGDEPPSRDDLREIVPKTEDYLRQSIRRFLLLLSKGHSLNEIRNNLLDKNLIRNGEFLGY